MHSSRPQLETRLDQLSQMLPIWLEKLRHPAGFWPQFDALAQQIIDDTPAELLWCVRLRLADMLAEHGLEHPLDTRASPGRPGRQGTVGSWCTSASGQGPRRPSEFPGVTWKSV